MIILLLLIQCSACYIIFYVAIVIPYYLVDECSLDSRLTMRALVTMESVAGMNIPVLTKIQSKLSDVKERVKLTNACTKPRKFTTSTALSDKRAYTLSDVVKYIERWINSTGCVPEPTWRSFFRILKDISPELGKLACQIKEIFGKITCICKMYHNLLTYLISATEAADDIAELEADLVQLQSSSEPAEEIMRKLKSSITFCQNILGKVQKADTEREQLMVQLHSKEKEVTELNEKLKLFKQAGICAYCVASLEASKYVTHRTGRSLGTRL